MSAVKVLLVDDHAVVREGLRALLECETGVEVVGEAADGEKALAMTAALSPDVVMLDISLPGMDGIEAARQLRRRRPDTRIIMISINDDAGHIMDSFKAGARGYVIKDAAPEEIALALERVHKGQLHCSEAVCRGLVAELTGAAELKRGLQKARELPAADRKLLETLVDSAGLSR